MQDISTYVLGKEFELRSGLNKKVAMKESVVSEISDNIRKQLKKSKKEKAKAYFSTAALLTEEEQLKRQNNYNLKVMKI